MGMIMVLIFQISSPGDSVGYTRYDYQRNGQTAWQVWYDGSCIHVDFMRAHESQPWPDRCCAYNFWESGKWFGDVDVTPGYSGYVALGVKASNNAGVCAYHHQAQGDIYRSWISVDEGQGYYNFSVRKVLPQETTEQLIWPRLAVDDQDNFHLMLHSYDYERIYYTRSTDDGVTWSDKELIYEESQANMYRNLDGGVFADRFNSPGKIIRYWTEWTGEGTGGNAEHAQDVWYQISTDYGETWGPKINLTNYQPSDTFRAFCHVKAIFDKNGDPHIAFPVNYFLNQTAYWRSWIIHWSPTTGFSVVTGPHSMSNDPGGWRLPCDFPNLALRRDNGWIYCIYVLNRDCDLSAGGYPNGDIFWKASTDNGKTWLSWAIGDTGVNITHTATPGCAPEKCCDDDYPSMHPYVEKIEDEYRLIISYVEDKDAGGLPMQEGTETDNPYRVYLYPLWSGVAEGREEGRSGLEISPNPIQGHIRIRFYSYTPKELKITILDASGRVVFGPMRRSVCCRRYLQIQAPSKAGVYFVAVRGGDFSLIKKVVVIR